jgi:phosphoribosylglycinamide formyltransferase-1
MDEMVNLAVDLRTEHFGEAALARAREAIERLGFTFERVTPGSDSYLAWIDEEFGGTWSGEAFAGSSVVAARGGRYAGFAAYDPRGLTYSWLRGLGRQHGVGIFGPFGVARDFRGSGIGPHLLVAALASLRGRGFERALIPAVGHEKLVAYYIEHSGASVAERFDKMQWRRARYRTVVLASGNGSNFQAVFDRVSAGTLPLDPVMLVSNKTGAYALERARSAGIHAVAFAWERAAQSRADYDADLIELIRREQPQLVLLLGWMHVLPAQFLHEFPETINIHPAFLPLDQTRDEVGFPDASVSPAFRGARAVADALASGSAWVGATSHTVSLDADRGPVLVRKPLHVGANAELTAVMQRLHPLEHQVLASGIMRWVFER